MWKPIYKEKLNRKTRRFNCDRWTCLHYCKTGNAITVMKKKRPPSKLMHTWCALGLSQWRYYWLHSVNGQFNLPGAVSCNLLQHHFNKIVMGRMFTIHKTISLPAERILKCYIYHFEIVMEWLFTFHGAIGSPCGFFFLKKLHFIPFYFK